MQLSINGLSDDDFVFETIESTKEKLIVYGLEIVASCMCIFDLN